MARARRSPAASRVQAVQLVARSPAALFGGGAPDIAASFAPAETAGPSLLELVEYVPPPLPAAPDAAAGMFGFVAANTTAAAVAPVPITYDASRRSWRLLANYSYVYEGTTLTALEGFSFDLASIPRPLWWLIAPNELSVVAPLFHDLLYRYKGQLAQVQVDPYRTFTRREADDLFYHLMEVEGIAAWRRRAAYSAVRAAGGLSW
ncbi:DUF1353 domain-containing protein [Urbifossiella limnaea]|uniref:DUF1353 domain-containing protein n=1 Tax=Urbifossiella limnaea TaxID=2528023 RepID=A0A517XY11_9BACT|nr:DUF1353 domain-containing protein [Urbifossiella limnaea]QDU22397.1 hypothetical protein ETAA1_43770 [Urbifossiella limnaea]